MARIDYCDTSKSNERTREILGKNRNANIFRMMAHSPAYFEQYCRLGGAIRHRGQADAGSTGRVAALGRLLHHDVEIPGNVCDRHAAGGAGGLSGRLRMA
jgi:hypothetical protein